MSNPAGRNLAASVQHRLLDYAKAKQDVHQLVLVRYGVERLLYRLGLRPRPARTGICHHRRTPEFLPLPVRDESCG